MKPRFQGYHLEEGGYRTIPRAKDGTIISQELGVILKPDGAQLRLVDPVTGQVVPSMEEAVEAAHEAQQQAEIEAQRADAAEAAAARLQTEAEIEKAQLRAEIEALKRQVGLI